MEAQEYKKLVKALRECASDDPDCIYNCPYYNHDVCADDLKSDAAAAIEDMAKHITEMHERVTVLQIARGKLEEEVEELKAKKMKLAENSLRFVGEVRELDKRRLQPKRGEIVRCGECKHWSEVDTSDGLRYGQCDHPHSAIRGNCFIRESWFCADGERDEA